MVLAFVAGCGGAALDLGGPVSEVAACVHLVCLYAAAMVPGDDPDLSGQYAYCRASRPRARAELGPELFETHDRCIRAATTWAGYEQCRTATQKAMAGG